MSSTDPTTAWATAFLESERSPEQVRRWVERTTGAILQEVPELAAEPDLVELLRDTVRQQWTAFVDAVLDPPERFELVPAAAEIAAELARRRVDLPVLLAAYRIAQRASWAYATEIIALAPPEVDRSALLVDFWGRAGQWLDDSTEASILIHTAERRRVERSGAARRYETVRRVLDGDAGDPRELSAELGGYPLGEHHTALILRALTPDAIGSLEPTAVRLGAEIGPGRPLIVEPGGHELWCWIPTRSAPEPLPLVEAPAGVRVAAGGRGAGIDGFVTSHEEAAAALPVATAGRLTRYDDVAALAILATSPVAAERFVRRTLRGLGDADPACARLRETLRCVLSAAGTEEAARTLGVHTNTVRYRIGQAEELLGHPISASRGDLDLALRYYDAFLD